MQVKLPVGSSSDLFYTSLQDNIFFILQNMISHLDLIHFKVIFSQSFFFFFFVQIQHYRWIFFFLCDPDFPVVLSDSIIFKYLTVQIRTR